MFIFTIMENRPKNQGVELYLTNTLTPAILLL